MSRERRLFTTVYHDSSCIKPERKTSQKTRMHHIVLKFLVLFFKKFSSRKNNLHKKIILCVHNCSSAPFPLCALPSEKRNAEVLRRKKIYLAIPSLTFPLYSCSSCLLHVYFVSPLFHPVRPRHLSVLGIHALFCH